MNWLIAWLSRLFGTFERPSPKIRIKPEDVVKTPDGILIKGLDPDCFVAQVADSNSMDPAIDVGMLIIEEPVRDVSDLIEGDIIVFEVSGKLIIHRIFKIGQDAKGWYCRTAGDNNSGDDPYIIRPENIRYLYRGQAV